jgi:hypothetical protein
MKAFILALFFTVTAAVSGFAGNVNRSNDNNDLVRVIQKQLHFTQQVRKKAKNATAIVTFVVNDNGQIEIREVTSENTLLKEDIIRQLQAMPISKTPVFTNTPYTLKIELKSEI